MQRFVYKQLTDWKSKSEKKPLILNVARQVGKTYILKKFGNNEYSKMAYVALDRNLNARTIFEKSTDAKSIIIALSAICN